MTYSATAMRVNFMELVRKLATDIMGEWTKYPHNPYAETGVISME